MCLGARTGRALKEAVKARLGFRKAEPKADRAMRQVGQGTGPLTHSYAHHRQFKLIEEEELVGLDY